MNPITISFNIVNFIIFLLALNAGIGLTACVFAFFIYIRIYDHRAHTIAMGPFDLMDRDGNVHKAQ